MALTLGRSNSNCGPNSAGVTRIALADRLNIASVTVSATPGATLNAITAIVMETDEVFLEYAFEPETLDFDEAGTFENNTALFDQVFSGSWNGWSQTDRNSLMELYASSPCGMVAIAELEDGTTILVGINPDKPTVENKYTLKMRTSKHNTGRLLQDPHKNDLVLGARSNVAATEFTPGWAGVPLS